MLPVLLRSSKTAKAIYGQAGQVLASSPYHDANWRYGVTKKNDEITGLWHFDEGEGNVAGDSSGSNNTAYLAGGQNNNLWLYQRNISLSPATSIDDYQVKIELNNKNFDYNKARSDGGDLRFFNINGVELSYWIEQWDTEGSSYVWVKIPNAGTNEITMKYGNSGANNKSNGNKVFDFFDDFSGTSLNVKKWSIYDNGAYISQNDKLIASGGSSAWGSNGLTSIQTFSRANNYELNFDYKPISGAQGMFGWHDSGTGTSYTDLVYAYYNNSNNILVYEDNNNRGTMLGSWVNNHEYKIKIPMKASGGATYERSINDGETYETTYDSTYSTETPLKVGIANYNESFEIDNLFVRKYATTDSTAEVGGLILTAEDYASQANWLDANWSHRTALYIENTNNNDLTDFQVPINIDSKLLIDAGQMQADGAVIRLTDEDGLTNINFWVEEGINTDATKLWVKVPSLTAKSTKTIYIYYGNSGATATSSYDNTFTKEGGNTSGLISDWHLDDGGSATTAVDSSGNNITMSVVNGPVWQGTDGGQWGDKSGQIFGSGDHLSLDGSDDYLQVPANRIYNFGTNDWTISTWFYPNAITTCDEIWAQNNPYNFFRIY